MYAHYFYDQPIIPFLDRKRNLGWVV